MRKRPDDPLVSAEHPCVLVAEDDHEMRALIATALRRDGYDVLEVADGAQLMAVFSDRCIKAMKRTPDLVISDVRMPGRTGLEVVATLRDAHWVVPVVLITAFGDKAVHREAARLGVVLFDKPFDIDDLRTVVLNLIWPPRPPSAA
jgi:CheY-like chemotaxis protein